MGGEKGTFLWGKENSGRHELGRLTKILKNSREKREKSDLYGRTGGPQRIRLEKPALNARRWEVGKKRENKERYLSTEQEQRSCSGKQFNGGRRNLSYSTIRWKRR